MRFKREWVLAASLIAAAGCSGDDDDSPTQGGRDASVESDGSAGFDATTGGGTGGGGGSGGTSGGTGGSGGGNDGGSVDGSAVDVDAEIILPPAVECARLGDACASAGECCSGICDPTNGACAPSIRQCGLDGASCATPTACCSLVCGADGKCGATACLSDNEACSAGNDCCSQSCTGGTCTPLNASCKTSGNTCGGNAECCSGLCKDAKCQIAASFCIQEGDICTSAADCCTGRCEIAGGATVGVCGPPPSGASFCNDGVEGSICDACNDCCSRLCAPFGPTGVMVCQPASGCHVTGDFCREDRDCCGADGTGLPGEGNVYCEKETGSDLGICRNPMSCSPQGNVCHFKDYACGVSSARANCCGGLGAKGGVCQLDGLGVPRCNGLGDTCRAAGDTCASADDCCDDVPCVADEQGTLRCMVPPDGGVCIPVDGPCTINADCCPGSTCVRPVGSVEGTCDATNTPTGGSGGSGGTGGTGGTGGSDSPPVCSEYGQACTTGADCCNSIPCDNGVCRVPLG